MSDTPDLVVVIMAGGAGTRFWPISTESRPKQFMKLFGERSLLQMSHDRVTSLVPPERILVLTSARYVPLVREQLPALPEANIVGEPVRRDTAAAIGLAALLCRERFGNPVMAVLTADHLIEPVELFQRTLLSAAREAASTPGVLYTFGIVPTYAATAYGYLQRGERVAEDNGIDHYRLLRFKEKPDLETAREYVASRDFFWNSGMFVWTTEAILAELARQLPDHVDRLQAAVEHQGGEGWEQALDQAFEPLVSVSIDYGVMEKAASVRCVASQFAWNDVGGWLALEDRLEPDGAGNAGRGLLHCEDASGNLVFCEDEQEVVALVGVRDLVVVRAGSRTLIAHRESTEAVKALVKRLDSGLR